MIRWLVARWTDWRRERRIADLVACHEVQLEARDWVAASETFRRAVDEAHKRSPAQLARLGRSPW